MDDIFIIYVIVWGILGLVFYLLDKKAKNISERRRLNNIGVVSIFFLMVITVILENGKGMVPGILLLLVFMPIAIFITNKYTYYCDECGKRVQLFGKDINCCPKCGGRLV